MVPHNIKVIQHYRNLAHASIESGYNEAISLYNKQKQEFIRQLNLKTEDDANSVLKQIQNELINISSKNDEEVFNSIFEKIESEVTSFIGNIPFDSESRANLYNALQKRLENIEKNKAKRENLYSNMRKALTEYFEKNGMYRQLLAERIKSIDTSNNAALRDQIFGYARQIALQKIYPDYILKNQSLIKSLAGLYKETLMAKATSNVLSQYNIIALETSSVRNSKNQMVKIDIVLGPERFASKNNIDKFLGAYINILDKINIKRSNSQSENIETPKGMLGGIQSKSWTVPWKQPSFKNYGVTFGQHSDKLPTGTAAYYWHAGVHNLMSDLINVIGISNFIFTTGAGKNSEIYFTSDLLKEFKERQYVIAFYRPVDDNKPIINSTAQAMLHNDK